MEPAQGLSDTVIEAAPANFTFVQKGKFTMPKLFQDQENNKSHPLIKKKGVAFAPLSLVRFEDPLPEKPEPVDRMIKGKNGKVSVRSLVIIEALEKYFENYPSKLMRIIFKH